MIFTVVILIILVVVGLLFYIGQEHGEEQREEVIPEVDKFKVGMVADIGGLDDQSFNDAAYRGLERAENELDIETIIIESKTITDYQQNLEELARQGCDMIWAVGVLMENALYEIADLYPEINFGIIDGLVDKQNVISINFKEEEGSFLMGVIAGLMTKTNLVGFVGGMNIPIIHKFQAGYQAGVQAINSQAVILSDYTGVFDSPEAGEIAALSLADQGVDIIFHASGACGIGVIKAAQKEQFYAIGVDSSQYHLGPYNVLSSMVKRVDVALYTEIKEAFQGNFQAGLREYGLQENGVGYSEHTLSKIPPEYMKFVDYYKKGIINKEIKVSSELE